MSIRTKILEKGEIVQEQLIRVLIKFDERITALEEGEGGTSYDDTALKNRVKALEDLDLDNRVKALEDAQTPDTP
jgi:hypothetical protein